MPSFYKGSLSCTSQETEASKVKPVTRGSTGVQTPVIWPLSELASSEPCDLARTLFKVLLRLY